MLESEKTSFHDEHAEGQAQGDELLGLRCVISSDRASSGTTSLMVRVKLCTVHWASSVIWNEEWPVEKELRRQRVLVRLFRQAIQIPSVVSGMCVEFVMGCRRCVKKLSPRQPLAEG